MSLHDVYAYGVISPSTLYVLADPFPQPDGYAEIARTVRSSGGEAVNSALVLRRLGLDVLLDGSWIADSEAGRTMVELLEQRGIDTRRLRVRKNFAGVTEFVVSDGESRTVFGTYGKLVTGPRAWNVPRKADVAAARIVCLDPPFREESALAGRYARELGVPFVTLDCPADDPLARAAASVVISGEFRARACPETPLDVLFEEYVARAEGLVVLTDGGREIRYGRHGEEMRRLLPYPVETLDSTGAGDSFRAGIAYGLLRGWEDRRVVEVAAAIAAMVCSTFPAVLRSPTLPALMRFMRRAATQAL
ncbi:MAG: carbohydrate kinase family protein [Gaiellaceae bacterium]